VPEQFVGTIDQVHIHAARVSFLKAETRRYSLWVYSGRTPNVNIVSFAGKPILSV